MTIVALFGATGQIGRAILAALIATRAHEVIQLVHPQSVQKAKDAVKELDAEDNVTTVSVDVCECSVEELHPVLCGIEVVVSALNGKALGAQEKIQDGAAKAGVGRFYPSEYGMHNIYHTPEGYGYLHPAWNEKEIANEKALRHPAVLSGKMKYTLIGCGDIYNQDREPFWCPWIQTNVPEYKIHIVGDPDVKADFTHINDLAAFIVKTIEHPELSENNALNFVSNHINHNEIAKLLEKYSQKKVEMVVYPTDLMARVWRDKNDVSAELKGKGPFPADFWILIKGIQGLGQFWRPPGQVHNELFPDVHVTAFEKYFQGRFQQSKGRTK